MSVQSFHPRSATVPPEQGMSRLCLRGGIVLNGNSLVGKSATEPMPAPTRPWNITTITGMQLNHGHWCVSICLGMWPATGRCVSGSPPESECRMPQCQPPMECSASLPDTSPSVQGLDISVAETGINNEVITGAAFIYGWQKSALIHATVVMWQDVTIYPLFLFPLTPLISLEYPLSSPLISPFGLPPLTLFVVPVSWALLCMISFAFILFLSTVHLALIQ